MSNPTLFDFNAEDGPPDGNQWTQVLRVIEQLTYQRDKLARANRKYEAGQGNDLNPLQELQAVRDAISKAIPDLGVSADTSPPDMLVRDLITTYWGQVKQRQNTAKTGFATLNDMLSGGIESKRLVCLLGAPNTGKTTFVHQIADHIACSGRPVLYVTTEDTPPALFAKTLARIGSMSYTAVLKGYESERTAINAALTAQMGRLSTDRLRYLDAANGVTLDIIREKAEAHFASYRAQNGGGPGVLVVDYLQRIARAIKTMSRLNADLREVVSLVTERLRTLACELDCGVLAVASQNRVGYTRSESTGSMASAKGSGDIEYTCDVLMALSEDRSPERTLPSGMMPIQLHIDKNRQGERGKSIKLDFWTDRQQFTEAMIAGTFK
ncbi:MAG TPA: DnaB-like helicase C-terminal domain-containing protein [Ktedonobacteraceae bacterium]|jgi:replicative DNA helicase